MPPFDQDAEDQRGLERQELVGSIAAAIVSELLEARYDDAMMNHATAEIATAMIDRSFDSLGVYPFSMVVSTMTHYALGLAAETINAHCEAKEVRDWLWIELTAKFVNDARCPIDKAKHMWDIGHPAKAK
ncbi:MAG: hypothetical protein WCG99_00700 [Candidatus Berkelbacteria bacterium]